MFGIFYLFLAFTGGMISSPSAFSQSERIVTAIQVLKSSTALDSNDLTVSEPHTWIPIKSYWIPETVWDGGETLRGLSPDQLSLMVRMKGGQREIRLFVHPEAEEFFSIFTQSFASETNFQEYQSVSGKSLILRSDQRPEIMFYATFASDLGFLKSGPVERRFWPTLKTAACNAWLEGKFNFMLRLR
jgi:hypothetical protein